MPVTHRIFMLASCILALNALAVAGFRMILNMNNVDNYFSINKSRMFSFPPLMKSSVDKFKEKSLQVSNNGKAATATTCAAVIVFLNLLSSPAFAAVGEGDLPAGAMAFSKILKYQSDWTKLADTIKTRNTEIDENEVLNIKRFLKQLANEYEDMELLGGGIQDESKAAAAKSIAKEFRKQIRQCDDAASSRDFSKIVEIYPQSAALLTDFLGLLQDVPDEI